MQGRFGFGDAALFLRRCHGLAQNLDIVIVIVDTISHANCLGNAPRSCPHWAAAIHPPPPLPIPTTVTTNLTK